MKQDSNDSSNWNPSEKSPYTSTGEAISTETDARSVLSLHSITSERKSINNVGESLSRKVTNYLEQAKQDNILLEIESQNNLELEYTNTLNYMIEADLDPESNHCGLFKVPTNKSELIEQMTSEVDVHPDGGYGWVCCACYLCYNISTWGSNASFGVYLSYYINNNRFPGASATDFALIGGIIVGLTQITAPFVLLLVKIIGFKQTLFLGTFLMFAGYILASFSTKIWQLYLSQGVICGISFALLFVPSSLIIQDWFYKKRSLASGIATAGTGLGGLVFSLSSQSLIDTTGSQRWGLRMIAIVCGFICIISSALVKLRNDPSSASKRNNISKKQILKSSAKIIFNRKALSNYPIHMLAAWFGLFTMAYVVLLFTLSPYGVSIGLTSKQASNVTAIVNLGQIVGRPSMGFIGDKTGRLNSSLVITATVTVLIFSFWLNCHGYASLIVYSFLTGLIMGCGQVNFNAMVTEAVIPEYYPTGYSYVVVMAGVLGIPAEVIALSLRNYDITHPYLYCQVFAGVIYGVSFLFLIPFREWKIRKILNERREALTNESTISSQEEKKDGEYHEVDIDKENSLAVYNELLGKGVKCYIIRLLYPIKT